MRFISILGIVLFLLVLNLVGILLIVVSSNFIKPEQINKLLEIVSITLNYRIVLGIIGILLILLSIYFLQIILGWYQKEKHIAFFTPTGQVTVSLPAVEDLIRRTGLIFPEIKDLRSDVSASKKGISVNLRVILKSESNLPEFTSRLQELTRSKLQEILGIEEPITIKIHIAKIILEEEKIKKKKDTETSERINVPFTGYGKII
ncbi:MAG: alkaline shock response membrane anchor protein AmaP [Candidatus Omnitrophica bacterium]|nr:alkaline shock response membrane anchor protein AmaP [Candidatus Omnitrophota bacterium]